MLKILVAEDEKLVRKGIIGVVDWHNYDAEIVGEADSGTAVLDFLSENEVNLLLTDLTMPNLSGLEYIEIVREKFPNVKIVVITMHRDFDMIQQAMRLGVSDYITKEQVQKDNFDETFKKILKKISKNENILSAKNQYSEKCIFNEGIVLCSLKGNSLEHVLKYEKELNSSFIKINSKYWIIRYNEDIVNKLINFKDDIYLVLACDLNNKTYIDIAKQLDKFENTKLFYDYNPEKFIYTSNLFTVDKIVEKKKDLEDIALAFTNIEVMNNENLYNGLINKIKDLNLSNDELQVFCYQLFIGWMQYTEYKINEYFEQINEINWWYQWKQWFDDNKNIIKEKVCGDSNETINKLMIDKAIRYVKDNYKEEISIEDILRVTNMSKSHFSKCFKKYTEKSFVSYLNEYRIEKSKELLLNTNQSIIWIAEYVGFSSERYFRRVFINYVGLKPIEFRNSKNIV